MTQSAEDRLIRKIQWKVLPLLLACATIAYLDRVNVSFASVTMLPDLGISAASYGLGVGLYFAAYVLFELPSNVMLARFGARQWIARIMVTWGLLSAATMFVHGDTSFYVLRFLLGIAEAGFFPGVLYYLNVWIPERYRGRVLSLFLLCVPLPAVIGAPLTGWLLRMDGIWGLAGWQWAFLIEALPAIALAFVVYFRLPNHPGEARWMNDEERALLARMNADEPVADHGAEARHILGVIRNRRVLLLALAYFGILGTNYGLSYFLPQMIGSFGVASHLIGYVTALPFLTGAIAMVLWARHSDRTGERWIHCALAVLLAVVCIVASALVAGSASKLLLLIAAGLGIFGAVPVFWTLPPIFLSGAERAPGIALINALGNLAGFCGPYMMGLTVQSTGGYGLGSIVIGIFGLIAIAIVLALRRGAGATGATPAPRPLAEARRH